MISEINPTSIQRLSCSSSSPSPTKNKSISLAQRTAGSQSNPGARLRIQCHRLDAAETAEKVDCVAPRESFPPWPLLDPHTPSAIVHSGAKIRAYNISNTPFEDSEKVRRTQSSMRRGYTDRYPELGEAIRKLLSTAPESSGSREASATELPANVIAP